MEGLAFGSLNRQLDPKKVRAVLDFTKKLLVEMMAELRR
jgi:hypothetical protein